LKKSKLKSVHGPTARLQRAARERADEQARRIPWQRLHEVRNQYIGWQEFYLWVRSVLEVEDRIPDWLVEVLNDRCKGFLETEKAVAPKAAKTRPLALRLEDWIDDHIFRFAKEEGWFSAVTYYAIREPRYQRAEVCWSECVEKWKKAKPIQYPSFEEWKAMAAQCDETARLKAREGKVMALAKLVDPDRLSEAVGRYMDYEALAYWARHALELGPEPPADVARELERRCQGYLETRLKVRAKPSVAYARDWGHLMLWVADHFFQDAKTAGWFDAMLIQVRSHPRAIRTMEFADHCGKIWDSGMPSPYPSFDDWRREADSYVELPVNTASLTLD
jgi:hypothetical protein